MGILKWNDDSTITIDPPKNPKKITGTRFAAIMGLNRWTSPFNAWCAITRTYEEPFEDTIYTTAGKIIEPKQAEYMREAYFWKKLVTPTDVFGPDYFKKTRGSFFGDSILNGMWDYLFVDKDGKPETVMEMKTTKRAEDWLDDIPEYYALQAALYAYLLGVDKVIMVCTVLEDQDYQNPDKFVVNGNNTFERPFKVSERYPDMEKTIKKVERWWKKHVEGGVSPKYDEKVDADILKVHRANTLNPETDLAELVKEAEDLQDRLTKAEKAVEQDKKRLDKLKDLIKEAAKEQFRDGDKKVVIPGSRYEFTTSLSVSMKFDEAAMKKDGVLEKYKCKPSSVYKLTLSKKE
jgi:predicted phage-related endonuclease